MPNIFDEFDIDTKPAPSKNIFDEFEIPDAAPLATTPVQPKLESEQPDEFGIGQEVRGVARGVQRGFANLEQARNVLGLNFRASAANLAEKRLEDAMARGDTREVARLQDFIGFNADQLTKGFEGIAAQDEKMRAIPVSPDMANLQGEFWKTLATNPVEVIATVTAESLPVALPGLVAGGLMGGPAGTAAGVGAGSFAVEYASSLMDSVRAANNGVVTPENIQAVFDNPQQLSSFRSKAMQRGIPVAFFDAISGGIAGRHVRALAKASPVGAAVRATAKDIGEQGVLGATGEAAGQLVSEGKITSVPDIALEGLAEFGTGPIEIAENVGKAREEARKAPKDSAKADQVGTQEQTDAAFKKAAEEVPTSPADTAATAVRGGSVITYTTKSGQSASLSVPEGKSQADALKMVERMGGKNPKVVVVPSMGGTPAPAATAAANASAAAAVVEETVQLGLRKETREEQLAREEESRRKKEPGPTPVEPKLPEASTPTPAPTPEAVGWDRVDNALQNLKDVAARQRDTPLTPAPVPTPAPAPEPAVEPLVEPTPAPAAIAPGPALEPTTPVPEPTPPVTEEPVTVPETQVPGDLGVAPPLVSQDPDAKMPTAGTVAQTPAPTAITESVIEAPAPAPVVPPPVEQPKPAPVAALVAIPASEPAKAKKFEVQASEKEKQSTEPMAPKAQKKFLIAELDKAIAEAPTDERPEAAVSKALDSEQPAANKAAYEANVAKFGTIKIEVPGDGTFTILNTKPALKTFREKANKFPVSGAGISPKPAKLPGPSLIVPVGKGDKEAITKASEPFLTKEEDRAVLSGMWSNGKVTVATDGRAMLIVNKGIGGTETAPVLLTPAGKKPVVFNQQRTESTILEGKDYPNWKQVIPDESETFVVASDVDTARLISVVTQAAAGIEKGDKGPNFITLWRNPDGTIGVEFNVPDKLHYEHNLQDGRELVGAFDHEYITASLEAFRRLGDEKVSINFKDPRSALVISAKSGRAIIMPARTSVSDAGMESGVGFVTKESVQQKPNADGFPPPPPTKPKRSKKKSPTTPALEDEDISPPAPEPSSQQIEEFNKAVRAGQRPKGEKTERVKVSDLHVGDEFKVMGHKVRVVPVWGPNGEYLGEAINGGKKYGTQKVGLEETLHLDDGSLDRAEGDTSENEEVTTKKSLAKDTSSKGMDSKAVEREVSNMVRSWTSGPNVVVIDDPDWIINGRGVEAEYDPETGVITLNAAYLRDANHAQSVLAEEALAHYGLESVFGEDVGRVLDELTVPDNELFDVARTYGLDISDPEQRRLAKAEWLGKFAQAEQSIGWTQRLVNAIRDWWNRINGNRTTDQHARELLAKASDFLTSGEARQRYFQEPLHSLGDDIGRIEESAELTNVKVVIPPKPVIYQPITKVQRFKDAFRRPLKVIAKYDPTKKLVSLKGQIDVQEAWEIAAVKEQARELGKSLFADAKAAMKWPTWFGGPSWRKRAQKFADLALPLAAHLNATGRKVTGEFEFKDFDMRVGTMDQKTFDRANHSVGDKIQMTHPLTGLQEELIIGPQITTPKGGTAYQMLRAMPASRQEQLYGHYAGQYPELSWFLDMWIDPDLANARMTVGPVDIPVFNRFALAKEMQKNDPNFSPLEGYTPDVLVNRTLLGGIIGAMQGIARGTVSPGRKYKTGRTRESGNVRDLLSGFSVRAFQAARENSRREWARAVLAAGVTIPSTGIPQGWADLSTGLGGLLDTIKTVNRMDPNAPYTEVLKRLANDGSPEYKQLVIEANRLSNKNRMLPQPLLDSVLQQFAAQETHGRLVNMLRWVVRNTKGLLLVHPVTILGNMLTNEFFALETATRYTLSGMLKLNPTDLRAARNLMSGLLLNRFAGLRLTASHVFGAPKDGTYLKAVQTILTPEQFENNTGLADIQSNYSDSVIDLLKEGEIASAALQSVGYGSIDLRAKQRMAYAFLKANAVTVAKRSGATGAALKSQVNAYMAKPPLEDMARAVGAANFELLNYADSPAFINWMSRSAIGSLFMPFPRFGYHFVTKQAQRVMAVRTLLGNVPAAERADAFADLVVVGLYGLGVTGAAIALFGGDDDDDARKWAGTGTIRYIDDKGREVTEPIDPELNTFNRINLSHWARAMGLGSEDSEEDFWVRVRTYPVLAAAGIGAIAMNDARKFGAVAGVKSYVTGMSELSWDFISLGILAKAGPKAWASMTEEATGRPQKVPLDNYSAGVPFMAWVGQQVGSTLIPGQRQADDMIMWIDPTFRRTRPSEKLEYHPGFWDGMRVGGTIGLLDRLASGGESTLPPQGDIKKTPLGFEVPEPRQSDPMTRMWKLVGINAKMVNQEAYEKAIGKVQVGTQEQTDAVFRASSRK